MCGRGDGMVERIVFSAAQTCKFSWFTQGIDSDRVSIHIFINIQVYIYMYICIFICSYEYICMYE